MKNKTIIILLQIFMLGLFAPQGKAFMHIGFIHYRQISGLQYEVNLLMIKDSASPSFPNQIPGSADDPLTGGPPDINIMFVKQIDSFPLPNGLYNYRFTDTITFLSAAKYEIIHKGCCRPPVDNIPGGGSASYTLHTVIDLSVDVSQGCAIFDNAPVTFGQVGSPWYWNPGFYDRDHDSLVCSIEGVQDTTGPIGTTIPGWVIPTDTMSIVDSTGEIYWMPDSVGHYLIRMVVREYDSLGVEKGATGYDFYFIVDSFPGNQRTAFANIASWPASVAGSVNAQGRYEFQAEINQTFTLVSTVQDPDGNQVQSLVAGGENLNITNTTSTFAPVQLDDSTMIGNYSWLPGVAELRTEPYFVVLRAQETLPGFTAFTDITFLIKVVDQVSNDHKLDEASMNLWPNPASGLITAEFYTTEAQDLSLEIVDLDGRLVLKRPSLNIAAGHVVMMDDVSGLNAGIYLVNITSDEERIFSKKLIVVR